MGTLLDLDLDLDLYLSSYLTSAPFSRSNLPFVYAGALCCWSIMDAPSLN